MVNSEKRRQIESSAKIAELSVPALCENVGVLKQVENVPNNQNTVVIRNGR